jgi:two-component system response regulator NreC
MQKIKVLVVDDHTIVRDGICVLLGLAGDIEVVGEAANGKEAIEAVSRLRPDVIVMDIAMPIMNGIEATRRIRKEFPEVKILALTQYSEKEHVYPIIEAGAKGFISKTAASSELASGVRAVYKGDSFLSPAVARVFVEDYQVGDTVRVTRDPYDELTDREREILKLLAEGYTISEIAEMLTLSPKTIDGHKTRLMSKLDIHSRTDLIKYAARKGIIII